MNKFEIFLALNFCAMTRGVVKNGDGKGSILPFIIFAVLTGFFLLGSMSAVEASSCSKKIIDFIRVSRLEKKDQKFLKDWSDSVKGLQGQELIDQNVFWIQTFLEEKVSSIGMAFALEQMIELKPNPSAQIYELIIGLLERSASRQEGSVKLDLLTSEFLGDLFAKKPDSISDFMRYWLEGPIQKLDSIVWSVLLDAIDWSFHSDQMRSFAGEQLLFEQMKRLPAHAKVSSDRVEQVNKIVWELQKVRSEYLAELNAHRMIELGEIDDLISQLVDMFDPPEGDEKFKLNRDYLDIDESLKDLEFLTGKIENMSETQQAFFTNIGAKALRNKETQSILYAASQRAEELLFLYSQNPENGDPKSELREMRSFYEYIDLLKYNEVKNLSHLGEISVTLDRMSKDSVSDEDWKFLTSLFQNAAVYLKLRVKQLSLLGDSASSNHQTIVLLRSHRSFVLQKDRFMDLINRWGELAKKFNRDTDVLELNLEARELSFLEKESRSYKQSLENLSRSESIWQWDQSLSSLGLDSTEVPMEWIGGPVSRIKEYWSGRNKKLGFPRQKSVRNFIRLAMSGQPIQELEDGDGNIDIIGFVQYLQERSALMQEEIEKSEYSLAELYVLVQRLRRIFEARQLLLQLSEGEEASAYVSDRVLQTLKTEFSINDRSLWLLFSSESLEDFKKRIFKIKALKKKGVRFASFSTERMESMGAVQLFEEIPWAVFDNPNPKK